jgi:dual specificity tyrosine-phosphorylation-regulated kinase 2/3/4
MLDHHAAHRFTSLTTPDFDDNSISISPALQMSELVERDENCPWSACSPPPSMMKFQFPRVSQCQVSQSLPVSGLCDLPGTPSLSPRQVFLSRYELISSIGYGAFGEIWRCYDRQRASECALKFLGAGEDSEPTILKHLNKLDPNNQSCIIRLEDEFSIANCRYLVIELLGRNLYDLRRVGSFSNSQLKSFARDVLTAIAFCHRHRIVHCDIKPENILQVPSQPKRVKLIDFGTSCFIGQPIFDYVQSRYYRAPEIIFEAEYGTPVDIWSFGCLVGEMKTGTPMFPGVDERDQIAKYTAFLGAPELGLFDDHQRTGRKDTQGVNQMAYSIGDELLFALILRCLKWDPKARITADEALNDAWFRELS